MRIWLRHKIPAVTIVGMVGVLNLLQFVGEILFKVPETIEVWSSAYLGYFPNE